MVPNEVLLRFRGRNDGSSEHGCAGGFMLSYRVYLLEGIITCNIYAGREFREGNSQVVQRNTKK